ncbi:MAG: hypothetical protein ACRD0D_09120, partial [Acidimicrobiales bacterium]
MARSRAGPPQPVDEGAAPSPAAQAANRSARILPLIAFPVAVWALLPPYSGPALNTAAKVEFVDHVVPSVAILLVAVASHVLARTRPKPGGALFMCGLVVLLAGIWMTATHLPLVAQATREEAPWGAT